MTGRGGAEGYLFTGIRVVPAEGRVEARGKFARKKTEVKVEGGVKTEEPEAKRVKLEAEVSLAATNGLDVTMNGTTEAI